MEMNITIGRFEAEVTPVVRQDNIKAFVNWIFHTNRGLIKIKGGTIKLKLLQKINRLILSYDPPAFKGKFKYFKAVIIDDKGLYKDLCMETLKKYCEVSGETFDTTYFQEEVNINDIP